MLKIENDSLIVSCKTQGAELTSIYSKKTKLEYLWNGDDKYWGRHAPVLFPIVGQVKDKTYKVGESEYHLSQHGFARDKDFKVSEHTEDSITFRLMSSEETLEVYPYRFVLEIAYTLEGDKVKTSYNVVNHTDGDMLFSIGGHPAFNCPLVEGSSFDDHYFEFKVEEKPTQLHLNNQTGLRNGTVTQEEIGKKLPLNYELFKNDAVIYEGLQSKAVSLKSTKHSNGLHFDFSEWKYLAFWTKMEGTPFVT